jgi:hypothetical protein
MKEKGFEVAHIIPHSLVNKGNLHVFIKSLVPWLPSDFFTTIDSCENMILLNQQAHKFFGKFEWFILMEEREEPLELPKSRMMDFCEDICTGRRGPNGGFDILSSFNQPLFIGTNSFPPPSKIHVRLHELLAQIFHLRGGAEDLVDDSDDDDVSLVQESAFGYQLKVDFFLGFQSMSTTLC